MPAAQEPPPEHIDRWEDRMAAGDFNVSHFRESSQWKVLIREHAQIVKKDAFVLERFLTKCPAGQQ
jgi:hypothetical protein